MSPFERRSAIRQAARASLILALLVAALPAVARSSPSRAQAPASSIDELLRAEIDRRYTLVRLTRGIGLVPRASEADIGMIEITDGTVAVDGVVVTGSELRERIGAGAEAILRLTYLDEASRLELLGLTGAAVAPSPPAAPGRAGTRTGGDRVRIFGDVRVERDESVRGDVVAVLGSVDVEGEVLGGVVAVLGSVRLGGDAVVHGEVTAVGGRVHRTAGAAALGGINEVAFGPPLLTFDTLRDWRGAWLTAWPAAGLGRLFGTAARLVLLLLLVAAVILVAPPFVDRVAARATAEPLKAGLVGLAAQLLFLPLVVLTVVILAVSIVGIPFLLLVPFVIVGVLLLAVAGFAGVTFGLGAWVRTRFSWGAGQPYVLAWLGVAVLLAPLVAARVLGLAGGFFNVLAIALVAVAVVAEYVAWTVGFGAAIIGARDARRDRMAGAGGVPAPAGPSGASAAAPYPPGP